MKMRTHRAAGSGRYLAAFGLDPDRVIYFDIETTGFRASTSSLYLIGWAVSAASYYACADANAAGAAEFVSAADTSKAEGAGGCPEQDGEWIVTQVLAESRQEEILLLEQFATVLQRYDTIVAFNGDRFDLPYMKEKYESYGRKDPFTAHDSVDLYLLIRPFRHVLGLTKLNQKSVERFLRIHREDPYSGGELIDVYRSYRDHRCPDEKGALDALFLHNYEDVLGMLDMTSLLSYRLALQNTSPVSILACSSDSPSDGRKVLQARFELEVPVPVPVSCFLDDCCDLTLSSGHAAITLRPYAGCLYHFFPDYKNYYYLPEEDTAIHKSVACFVSPAHREKAKAKTCYVKKEGAFLPAPEESGGSAPLFERCYRDSVRWIEYRPEMTEDPGLLSGYIHSLVRALFRNAASPGSDQNRK